MLRLILTYAIKTKADTKRDKDNMVNKTLTDLFIDANKCFRDTMAGLQKMSERAVTTGD